MSKSRIAEQDEDNTTEVGQSVMQGMKEAVVVEFSDPINSEAVKFDKDKIRYELLPPELLEGTSSILTFGAKKYGERNWEKGILWSRVFGALMRHMWAWWRGEKADPETGYSHLWHASACLAFLMSYEQRGTGKDDRPKEHPLG